MSLIIITSVGVGYFCPGKIMSSASSSSSLASSSFLDLLEGLLDFFFLALLSLFLLCLEFEVSFDLPLPLLLLFCLCLDLGFDSPKYYKLGN